MDQKENSNLLKEYVRSLIEANLVISGEEFEVSDEVLQKIRAVVANSKSQKNEANVSDYPAWLKSLSKVDEEKATRVDEIVQNAGSLQDELKSLLSKKNPRELTKVLFRLTDTPSGRAVRVPSVLADVAGLATPTKKGGVQIGKGEIAIRFMFSETKNNGPNDLFDVRINGEPWHVKAGSSEGGIKMGSAKGKMFISTNIANLLVKSGIAELGDMTELSQSPFARSIVAWASELARREEELSVTNEWSVYYPEVATPEGLYEIINAESIEASMGDAVGVVWYEAGQLFFNVRESITMLGSTQGRVIVSSAGREKIMSIVRGARRMAASPEDAKSRKAQKTLQKDIFIAAFEEAAKSKSPSVKMAKKLLSDLGVTHESGYIEPNDSYYDFVKYASKRDPAWVTKVLEPSLDEI
jgi:hypothetical protein